MALSWSHTVLHIKDTEKMLDFYTRVLGFEVTDRGMMGGNGSEIIFMSQSPEEHHQLAFIPTREDDGRPGALAHIAFRTGDMPEFRALIDGLKNDSVALRPLSHGNTWSVYFQDPEGNGVEIFCDTPWHVSQPAGETWDTSLDDDALLEWTRRTFEKSDGFSTREDYHKRRAKELAAT